MKKTLMTLALAAFSLLAFAQPRQTGPSDWGNFKRYEQANAELTSAPLVVLMGDSITDFWYNEDPDFFTKNNFAGRGISGQTASQMLVRFKQDVVNLLKRRASRSSSVQSRLARITWPFPSRTPARASWR